MKKNKLAKMLSLMLVMGLGLSACGAKDADVQESSKSTQSSAEKSESEASSEEPAKEKLYWEMLDEVSDTSDLPDWTGETLEINIWYAGGTTVHEDFWKVDENNLYWNEIERVTGIKVNWEECYDNGGNNIDAKLPMVIASGDLPTMIVGHGIQNQMEELFENGYLLDLTKYYEAGYLDQLTEKWYPMDLFDAQIYSQLRTENGEYYKIQYKYDGVTEMFDLMDAAGYGVEEYDAEYYKQYATTPKMRSGMVNYNCIWVRDDIIKALYPDALTMDEIEELYMSGASFTEDQIYDLGLENMDDFIEFLYDVQELIETGDYVDKNGNKLSVTYGPHTETDNWTYATNLPNLIDGMFGFDYFSYLNRNATDASDFLKRTIDSEEYVEYLSKINALVREDIIAQDSMLDNSAMNDEKILNHRYAVTYYNNMSDEKGMGDGYRYRPIFVKGEVGEEIQAVSAKSLSSYMGICNDKLSDEQVEQIIHMINYVNSTVGLKCKSWGPASAGLFTVDADGNRTLTDEKLYNEMVLKNGEDELTKKYGFYDRLFNFVGNQGGGLLSPRYYELPKLEKNVKLAYLYFSPGVFAHEIEAVNDTFLAATGIDIYGTGQVIEGLETFWKARAGFEDQMKKVLVAEDEAAFEAQLTKLREYADNNGFTAEAMKEFSEWWAEQNEANLKAAGKLK